MPRDRDAVAQESLAVRCRRGDRAALEELVRCWEERLLYFIRRLIRDETDAWDVLQKTWVRVLAGIGSLDDPAEPGAVALPHCPEHGRTLIPDETSGNMRHWTISRTQPGPIRRTG